MCCIEDFSASSNWTGLELKSESGDCKVRLLLKIIIIVIAALPSFHFTFRMDYRPLFICLLVHVIFVKDNGVVYGQLYHVTPNINTPCPQEPCISLTQLAINSSIYASNTLNVILYFLPGHHSLDLEIAVSNLENFTMTNLIRDDNTVVVVYQTFSKSYCQSHYICSN